MIVYTYDTFKLSQMCKISLYKNDQERADNPPTLDQKCDKN